MEIVIHRGTHQIGGIAAEIRTGSTRIVIDMGDELFLDPGYVSRPLQIPGVTDESGRCDAVLFTHYHGDHVGQLGRIREGIPLYAGALAKDIMLLSDRSGSPLIRQRIESILPFVPGRAMEIGDIRITPYSIDHSASDSYMFLIEADGKRLLYTGDFRLHGFRGKGIPKILDKLVQKVDVLVTEGTTISRPASAQLCEHDLQKRVREYMAHYKYVFVLSASTNFDRIFGCAHAVPRGKYFLCDGYQEELMRTVETHWGAYSSLYRIPKLQTYGENLLPRFREKGFLMMVRDNRRFTEIVKKFDPSQSIMLYSMWDGYRTRPGSTIPAFLSLTGRWEPLHTSGHASAEDIRMVIEKTDPQIVIPIHTDAPDTMKSLCPGRKVIVLLDGDTLNL